MDLSIIIVNWNSKEYLQRCIASILSETRNLKYEIIVIDSASYDGSEMILRTYHPQVRFIQSKINVGFAKANNIAYKASTGQKILFLNPDTELVGPAINTLYCWLNSLPNPGIVGCKLLNSDRSIQTSCIQPFPTILNIILDSEYLRKKWPKSSLWGMESLYGQGNRPKKAAAISGACMMMKRDVFEAVGLFSEDYFMYTEDIDLSYKVRQAGFLNYYVPDAEIVHFGGSSSKSAPTDFSVMMMHDSIWRFFRKTRGKIYGYCYRVAIFLSAFCRVGMLAVIFPGAYVRNQLSPWRRSIGKWSAIIRWCLYREEWLKKHKFGQTADASPKKVSIKA